jgi:hypothetical protein
MSIINNQALDPKLDQHSHEFALALAPTASERQSQRREQIIAQGLLAFIVFWSCDSQDRITPSRERARRRTRRSYLVVHSLNACYFWKQSNTSVAWGSMPPPFAPDKGMLMGIPVGRGILHRLLDLLPGLKAPPFERQGA